MTTEQKLRATIYATARQIAKETLGNLNNMEIETEALDLIAELTYKKLLMYGADLEAFQKHAKRSTVNADDVRLLVRRNNSLKELIEHKLLSINASKPPAEPSTSGVKRKRKGAL